jgi:hypothetical protein
VFFAGGPGDGKTSFINKVAVDSASTHVFLRWKSRESFDYAALTRFRMSLLEAVAEAGVDSVPTIVVVYVTQLYGNEQGESELISELAQRAQSGDDMVILVEGRIGVLNRLRMWVDGGVEDVRLLNVSEQEAEKWLDLIKLARDELKFGGMSQEAVDHRYPNLNGFLQSGRRAQLKILRDRRDPLLVRLLRAVYGENMWKSLVRELEGLEEADQRAYFHVCLATVAGVALPESVLSRMAGSEANITQRSDHDPWIRKGDEHAARHSVVASVVIAECGAARWTRLKSSMDDYLELIREDPWSYLDILRQVSMAPAALQRVRGQGDQYNEVHSQIMDAVRAALLAIDDLANVVKSCAEDGGYKALTDWFQAFARWFLRPKMGLSRVNLI